MYTFQRRLSNKDCCWSCGRGWVDALALSVSVSLSFSVQSNWLFTFPPDTIAASGFLCCYDEVHRRDRPTYIPPSLPPSLVPINPVVEMYGSDTWRACISDKRATVFSKSSITPKQSSPVSMELRLPIITHPFSFSLDRPCQLSKLSFLTDSRACV